MKNSITFRKLFLSALVVFLVLSGFFTAANSEFGSAQARTLSLCDYYPPETSYRSMDLALNYYYYDDPTTDEVDIHRGTASTEQSYIYSTPNHGIDLRSSANLSLSKGRWSYESSGTGRYNMYLPDTDLFGFGGLHVDFSDRFTEFAGIKAITGSGYGRFRNVTPLARSMLIDRMLLDRGAIAQNISDDVLQQIAREIGAITPDTDLEALVEEIVSKIETEVDLVVDELGPLDVLRIREIVEEGIEQRLCGWEVRGGFAYEILHPYGAERDFLVDAAARYARPFSPYSQLLLEANFSSTFEIAEDYSLTGLASYQHRIHENLSVKLQYSLLYQQQSELDPFYQQSFSTTAEVQLGPNLSSSASFNFKDQTDYERLEKEVSIGLSYSLI